MQPIQHHNETIHGRRAEEYKRSSFIKGNVSQHQTVHAKLVSLIHSRANPSQAALLSNHGYQPQPF